MNKNLVLSFAIGFTSGLGTMSYLASAYHSADHPPQISHPEFILLLPPFVLGLVNVLNVYTDLQYSFWWGILVALGFSTFGIKQGLPKHIFHLSPLQARIRALVYYTVLFWFLNQINRFVFARSIGK